MERTIKLPVTISSLQDFLFWQKKYNSMVRYSYNRICEKPGITTKEMTVLQKQMKSIYMNSHISNCAFQEARTIFSVNKDNPGIIFGGKQNFVDRCQNKISKEEFQAKRLLPFYSIGEAKYSSNRFFRFVDCNKIMFKPNRKIDILLTINSKKLRKNLKQDLAKLWNLQQQRTVPITYKLSQDYIYISFENDCLYEPKDYKPIKNRIFSIDLNPNYIGYSIIDWTDSNTFKIIDKKVISIKKLNDEWFAFKNKSLKSSDPLRQQNKNKRKYEIVKIADFLVQQAKHFKCKVFGLEKLSIESSNKKLGKKFNSLCNNLWNRDLFTYQIKKRCSLSQIQIVEVEAAYSSFIGNTVYRSLKLPDMVLSSIEISRRAFEFYHQWILKDKPQEKNIIFNENSRTKLAMIKSLEEFNFSENWSSFRDLYNKLKILKIKYRVPLAENAVFRHLYSKKSRISYHTFSGYNCSGRFITQPKGMGDFPTLF